MISREIGEFEELKQLYQTPDAIKETKKRTLQQAGRARRKEGVLVRMVQCGVPKEKRPLGRLQPRWDD